MHKNNTLPFNKIYRKMSTFITQEANHHLTRTYNIIRKYTRARRAVAGGRPCSTSRSRATILASFPGRFCVGGKLAYCWRMRLVPKISGNLDTPRILSVFPNSNPSFYVRILHLCKIASAGEDNFMDYAMVSNARIVSEALCV